MNDILSRLVIPFLKPLALIVLLFSQIQFVSAELILTAPPRETKEAGQKLYGPLAARLTELVGETVTYEHPVNWLAYQRDMRNDKYDIIFDGPHFISWRIRNKDHKAVVKLPGTLEFVIVARKDDDKVTGLDDLIGRKICGIAPPNLGTLTVYAAYEHPARQPVIVPVRGGFKKVYKSFEAGKCKGAVFRTTFYAKKLTDEQRAITKVLYKSPALPNQGISMSSRVKPAARKLIIDTLSKGDRIPATKNILARFGGKAKAFQPASDENFAGHYKLIEGVIFGW
jgi:ABC-type phosphate/phosphonate transport system substrate-binding protein